jgi:2-polyprenyl-6-methoxyphenol hydroxylase-like FAD-dependent oxidoreductase
MHPQSGLGTLGTLQSGGRVHVIGAGPVGLLMTALLQGIDGLDLRLYEKRGEYTRARMVRLAQHLVADEIEDYRAHHPDRDDIDAVFEPAELSDSLTFRRSIPSDLMTLLQGWTRGFCPLNEIERSLSDLIDERETNPVERIATALSADDAIAMVEPGDLLVDCTGSRSLLRDHLTPDSGDGDADANTLTFVIERALVITFIYGQTYVCNEYCKYYKNVENAHYKFIPMVNRVAFDGTVTHVTGIITITADEYEAMPKKFDGEWLRENFPTVAQSMDRFIDNVKLETQGELVGDIEIIRIPLNLYRARNATSRRWDSVEGSDHPFATTPAFLVGDAAIGSPYFQSISLGFECAMYLAGLIAQPELTRGDVLDRYEQHIYKQWLRVYMQSKMIKNNKDVFQSLDDPMGLLDKLHIY